MWRRWGTWEFLFWHLLMSFEKPKKSEFWENEKNCWIYHHFTHVYQKPQPYEIQFLRYRVRQSFWTFPPPPLSALPLLPSPPSPFPLLRIQKTKILKKGKKHLDKSSFWTCATKKHDQMMYAYSGMECGRHTFLSS